MVLLQDILCRTINQTVPGHLLIILLLQGRHLHPQDLLHFGWEGLLYILLHPTQEERLQHLVKALVAILTPFPMVVLKVFPGLKPDGGEKRVQRGENE